MQEIFHCIFFHTHAETSKNVNAKTFSIFAACHILLQQQAGGSKNEKKKLLYKAKVFAEETRKQENILNVKSKSFTNATNKMVATHNCTQYCMQHEAICMQLAVGSRQQPTLVTFSVPLPVRCVPMSSAVLLLWVVGRSLNSPPITSATPCKSLTESVAFGADLNHFVRSTSALDKFYCLQSPHAMSVL